MTELDQLPHAARADEPPATTPLATLPTWGERRNTGRGTDGKGRAGE